MLFKRKITIQIKILVAAYFDVYDLSIFFQFRIWWLLILVLDNLDLPNWMETSYAEKSFGFVVGGCHSDK